MEFKAIVDGKLREAAGCAVVGVYENGELGIAGRRMDAQLGGLIVKMSRDGDFAGKLGDALMLHAPAGAAAARVLLLGLGSKANFARKQYRKVLQTAAQTLAKSGANDAIVYLTAEEIPELDASYRARIVAEIFLHPSLQDPRSENGRQAETKALTTVSVAMTDARAVKAATRGLEIGAALGSGIALARDLGNLPPNVCTPTYIGTSARCSCPRSFPASRRRCWMQPRSRHSKWVHFWRSRKVRTSRLA